MNRVMSSRQLLKRLLPIARRMLGAGSGVGTLIEAAKIAYVQAATEKLFPLGGRINISRLSVATGLTRKQISAHLRAGEAQRCPSLRNEQRTARVIRGWQNDRRFRNGSGNPADLPMRGRRRSFELLVKIYGGDVTPVSVRRELERIKAVRVNRSGELRLRLRPSCQTLTIASRDAGMSRSEPHTLAEIVRDVALAD